MAFHVVYRSYGGENMKDRPVGYSKLACLVSFLRAAEQAGASTTFLNDGPMPENRLKLMQAAGTVVSLTGAGMRGSYRAALELATSSGHDRDDVVWFSEDDYLYRPDSLSQVEKVASRVPEASYFAVYATTWAWPAQEGERQMAHRPRGWHDLPPWSVDGQDWVRIRSTTSTFGARVGALTEDLGIFRMCMVPHRNSLRDHDTSLIYQGYEPHSYRVLARDLVGRFPGTPRQRTAAAVLAPFLIAGNLRSHRRPDRRRIMLASQPNLATHMEASHMAHGTDWAQVLADVQQWGEERSMLSAPSAR